MAIKEPVLIHVEDGSQSRAVHLLCHKADQHREMFGFADTSK
jgi:hypothetical protein